MVLTAVLIDQIVIELYMYPLTFIHSIWENDIYGNLHNLGSNMAT